MTVAVHSPSGNFPHHLWTGLASDTKPTPGNTKGFTPLQNDQFYETDTGNLWIFAAGVWKTYTPAVNADVFLWQPSTLSWIKASADANGNLNVNVNTTAGNSMDMQMLLAQILAELRALRLQDATVTGIHVDPLIDSINDTMGIS